MRTLRIRRFMRFCDGLVAVLSVLALVSLFNRITGNHRRFIILEKNSVRSSAKPQEESNQTRTIQGRLAVQVWKNICGGKMANLFDSPFFPKFFDESYFISQTRAQLNTSNYGQRIFGYLHPPETGYYRFVLYSDDGSEFWFSHTADLQHMKLVASVASRQTIGSAPVGEIRYNTQLSGDFFLEYGTKYPFDIVHLQGTETDFIELRWIRPGKNSLEVIGSKHVSCCNELQPISGNFRKFAITANNQSKFFLVAFLTEWIVQRTLKPCGTSISLPVAAKPNLPRFHGYKAVQEMHTVTRDWDENWRSNSEAKAVVELFMQGLEKIFPRKYSVTRLLNLERFSPGKVDGAMLYLLELELGCDALDYTERVVEYVYLQNIGQEAISSTTPNLCYPKGMGWRKEAMVHLILSVDNEDQQLRRFIEKLEIIIEESLEVDFHLVIVHSCNSGLDIESLLKKSSLQRYQVRKLQGKFSKARAINAAVNLVQNPDDIILICDVHVVLPPTIFEDCRKHCLNGKMVFAPVLFSLECGAYPNKPQGSWCEHDYRMIGVYQKDWTSFGGLDETLQDQLVPLALVDRILANGLHVARVRSPKLYLLFHPKAFDPHEPINVQNAQSGYFREDMHVK